MVLRTHLVLGGSERTCLDGYSCPHPLLSTAACGGACPLHMGCKKASSQAHLPQPSACMQGTVLDTHRLALMRHSLPMHQAACSRRSIQAQGWQAAQPHPQKEPGKPADGNVHCVGGCKTFSIIINVVGSFHGELQHFILSLQFEVGPSASNPSALKHQGCSPGPRRMPF